MIQSQDYFEFKMYWKKDMRVDWNEICIWVTEQFGLPGGNYITEVSTDYMIFKFKDAKDYVWMKMRWA